MTKQILIDPIEARKKSVLKAPEIPVNAYVSDPKKEAKKYGVENLVRIYRDMVFLREFETSLDRIKKEGVYAVPYAVDTRLSMVDLQDVAEVAAKAEAINDFLTRTLTSADPWSGGAGDVTVVEVLDAAVEKAYGGKRKISWMEVFAGETAFRQFGDALPVAGPGRLLFIGLRAVGLDVDVAREQVHVLGVLPPRRAWQLDDKRVGLALRQGGECLHHLRVVIETVQAAAARTEFARRLRPAEQQQADDGEFTVTELQVAVAGVAEALCVFFDTALEVLVGPHEMLVLQLPNRMLHFALRQRHDRIARGFLVAGVGQGVERQREYNQNR